MRVESYENEICRVIYHILQSHTTCHAFVIRIENLSMVMHLHFHFTFASLSNTQHTAAHELSINVFFSFSLHFSHTKKHEFFIAESKLVTNMHSSFTLHRILKTWGKTKLSCDCQECSCYKYAATRKDRNNNWDTHTHTHNVSNATKWNERKIRRKKNIETTKNGKKIQSKKKHLSLRKNKEKHTKLGIHKPSSINWSFTLT